jgi:hypothetical protein
MQERMINHTLLYLDNSKERIGLDNPRNNVVHEGIVYGSWTTFDRRSLC